MKIHESSQTTVNSVCDIFAAPNTDASVLSSEFVEIPPVNESNDGTLHFKLSTDASHYMVMNESYLEIEGKVVNADGSTIGGDPKVYLTDGGMHSLFESVAVSIDGQDVSFSSEYPYSSMVETLLSHDLETKKSHLEAGGWFEDSISSRNPKAVGVLDADNTKRIEMIKDSRTFQLSDRLHVPLFLQEKLLAPGLNITTKAKRTPPEFALVRTGDNADGTYKILITKATMIVRICEVQPAIARAHQLALKADRTYKYDFDRIKVQTTTITAGVRSFRNVIQVGGNAPKKLIAFFINNDAKQGSYSTNPFVFEHAHVSACSLTANGRPTGPKVECDFENKNVNRAYRSMNATTETLFTSTTNGITIERFIEGRTFFCFNLQSMLTPTSGVTLINQQSLELNFTFKEPLAATLTLCIYSQLDELLEIDKNHSIRMINNII